MVDVEKRPDVPDGGILDGLDSPVATVTFAKYPDSSKKRLKWGQPSWLNHHLPLRPINILLLIFRIFTSTSSMTFGCRRRDQAVEDSSVRYVWTLFNIHHQASVIP